MGGIERTDTHLELQGAFGAHDDVFVETLFSVVWELKS